MKRRSPHLGRLALFLPVLLVPALGAGADRPDLPRGPEEGKVIFAKTCAACHGPDARGIPGLGKDLVAGAFSRESSDADLIAFIERGRPADDPANTTGVAMPPKGGNPALTRQDIADVVAYLRTLQEP